MLREIGDVKRIKEYVARAKDKNDPFRLMGFGHRVYKNYDPRAKVMQQTAEAVLKELKLSDPVLDVARELSRSRSTTIISSKRSSIPTSISTRASSSTPWASRPRCSPLCSPSPARSAGSRSGTR